jgi:uncharacterized membrane protein YphA (DoxX/SURF4 family)
MVDMFADIGIGQWFRYVVGSLDIAGAIGLLVPRVCGLAAAGLAVLMLGAVITTIIRLDDSILMPLGLMILAAGVAVLRWPRTRDLVARFGGQGR